MKNVGSGRIGYLSEPISIRLIVEKLKQHFKMKAIRLALANGKTLGKIEIFVKYFETKINKFKLI
jgi:hypothetical protein